MISVMLSWDITSMNLEGPPSIFFDYMTMEYLYIAEYGMYIIWMPLFGTKFSLYIHRLAVLCCTWCGLMVSRPRQRLQPVHVSHKFIYIRHDVAGKPFPESQIFVR